MQRHLWKKLELSMKCTGKYYKEHIKYTFHAFYRLSYEVWQSLRYEQETRDTKEKYALNILQMKGTIL